MGGLLCCARDNIVSINEMLLALRRLQKVPNETKLQRIIEVLDDDQDGNINVNLALKVSGRRIHFVLV
jgi:Ca2+-binding EF-hand superfamily protein